jgi:thiol-disulfide isomerase/thioredoxin
MPTESNLEQALALGAAAPDFDLLGVDERRYRLSSFAEYPILIVAFTCNHCPYVQAYEPRLIAIQRDYADRGVAVVAINSNDERGYPEDSFAEMVERAQRRGYNFPYLRDGDQVAARAYRAQCTPELYVFDHQRTLRYQGRIDDNWRDESQVKRRELREALDALLAGQQPSLGQTGAIGCSIKWTPGAPVMAAGQSPS